VIRVDGGDSPSFAAAEQIKRSLLSDIAAASAVGRADLSRLDLSKVDLSGVDISKVDLSRIDLSHVDPAMIAHLAASASRQSGPAPGLSFVKPPVTPGEPLRLEISSFLESVRTRRQPLVAARQGREALALALEIQSSMAAHAKRAGLEDFFNPGA